MNAPADRAELVRGLRELADWYEQHPEVPLPTFPKFGYHLLGTDADKEAEIEVVAGALGVEVRTRCGGHLLAERRFGLVEFEAVHVPSASMRDHEARTSYNSVIQVEATGGAR